MSNKQSKILDPHLNIFYSYDQGKYKTDRNKKNTQKQLEDNVTRAFIITLMQLSVDNRKIFFEKLTRGINFNTSYIYYDLQAIHDDYIKSKNEVEQKLLLTITRSGAVGLSNENEENEQGSRADAWILNDEFCILLEVKVGDSKVYKDQINRHITDAKGLNAIESDVTQIDQTWNEVDQLFQQLNLREDNENYFVSQFREFLNMIGETMNFKRVFEEPNLVDESEKRKQLKLLIECSGIVKVDTTL